MKNFQINDLLNKIEKCAPNFDKLKAISKNKCISITFCNPSAIKFFKKNNIYRTSLKEIDFIYSDGILLCKFLELFNKSKYERISFDGNSIAPLFFKFCYKNSYKACFIGGKPNVADSAKKIICNKFNVEIPFTNHGYFNDEDLVILKDRIKKNNIKLIVVGMGVPKQELVANFLKKNLNQGIVITCGGYLDQIVNSKSEKYYPYIFSKLNLRFLYRLLKEPKRMIFRYTIDYYDFYKLFFKFLFKSKH